MDKKLSILIYIFTLIALSNLVSGTNEWIINETYDATGSEGFQSQKYIYYNFTIEKNETIIDYKNLTFQWKEVAGAGLGNGMTYYLTIFNITFRPSAPETALEDIDHLYYQPGCNASGINSNITTGWRNVTFTNLSCEITPGNNYSIMFWSENALENPIAIETGTASAGVNKGMGWSGVWPYNTWTSGTQYRAPSFYLFGNLTMIPTVSGKPSAQLISPDNNSVNGTGSINFTYNMTSPYIPFNITNATIYIVGPTVYNKTNTSAIFNYSNSVLNYFNVTGLTEGSYNWTVEVCDNNTNCTRLDNFTLILDFTNPTITSNFTNNSVHYKTNITAQINFTDNNLFSINISIDNSTVVFNITNITNTFYIYNMSYNISSLSAGYHNLSIYAADGHTKNKIPDYEIKNGLFNNYLEYTTSNNKIKISPEQSSIFDKMTTEKQSDRYTFNYIPNNKKNEHSFIVESQEYIYIMNNEKTHYKTWLISKTNWIDFYMEDYPNIKPIIERINDKTVRVTLKGLNNVKEIKFSSIGDLNINILYYRFYIPDITYTQNQTNTNTGVGDTTTFALYVNVSNLEVNYSSIDAIFNISNFSYIPSKFITGNITFFTKTITWNTSFGNSSGVIYNANWIFNVTNVDNSTNITEITNTTNMTISQLSVDDCTSNNVTIFNFTLYDETSKEIIDLDIFPNTTIETDLTLTSGDYNWLFNITKKSNNLSICVPFELNSTTTDYLITSTTKYLADNHATEYHFFENLNLTNRGKQNVYLYTLNTNTSLSEYSTSFILNFLNKYYLPETGAIVDLLREYVGLANFTSVEHAKFDSEGDAVLHLVAENIRYKIIIRKNNEIIFTSSEFTALCQTTPCQISFTNDEGVNTLPDYAKYPNLIYNINLDKSTNKISATFATDDGTLHDFNLLIKPLTAYSDDYFCNESIYASGGTLTCSVDTTYQNRTEDVTFKMDNETVSRGFFKLNEDNPFKLNGVFFTILLFLTLVFIALPSGAIPVIIFSVLGIVMSMSMLFLSGGGVFVKGSSIFYLIAAAIVILIKAARRNV